MDRIEELADGVRQLAEADAEFKTFGSNNYGHGHRYQFNTPIPLKDLEWIEREYAIQLPDDYRQFLLRIGDGGAGPYYGLYDIDAAIDDEPQHRSRHFLSSPFPLTEKFNPDDTYSDDDELDEDQFISGSVVLSHHGCAYYDRLVITGPQRDTVWSDFRAAGEGFVPLGCDFFTWYSRWIIDSLAALNQQLREAEPSDATERRSRPFWKWLNRSSPPADR